MIKENKQITTTRYILDENDVDNIKWCLNYCYHRRMIHGIQNAGNLKEIQRLREEFGIKNKPFAKSFKELDIDMHNEEIIAPWCI